MRYFPSLSYPIFFSILVLSLYIKMAQIGASSIMQNDKWILIESIAQSSLNRYMATSLEPSPEKKIEIAFRVKQKNVDVITKMLEETSNPNSSNYGKRMTKLAVDELTRNDAGVDIVLAFLGRFVVTSIDIKSSHLIHAIAPISVWELALNTKFHEYIETATVGKTELLPVPGSTLIRTEQYYLPEYVANEVDYIDGTVQFPLLLSKCPKQLRPT